MKKIIVFVLVFGLFSCQNKEAKAEKKCTSVKEKKLEMYEMSEMATLMEQMYVDNKRCPFRLDPKGKFECERFSFSLCFEGRDCDCVERRAHQIGALAGGLGCGAARTRKPDRLHMLGPS
jgi:hypothetical protein